MATSKVEPKFLGLKGMFATETYTLDTDVTVAASGALNKSITITKAGYYPISILSWSVSSSWFSVNRAVLTSRTSGSATLQFRLRSYHTSSVTIGSIIVYVLWMKE